MWSAILPVVGSMLTLLFKHYLSERQWSKVREAAKVVLADPERTDDPREAVAQALIQAQLDRVAAEAEKVAIVLNGSNPVPKVKGP